MHKESENLDVCAYGGSGQSPGLDLDACAYGGSGQSPGTLLDAYTKKLFSWSSPRGGLFACVAIEMRMITITTITENENRYHFTKVHKEMLRGSLARISSKHNTTPRSLSHLFQGKICSRVFLGAAASSASHLSLKVEDSKHGKCPAESLLYCLMADFRR